MISVALDEELPELESRWLRTHRARCSGCELFAAELASFTEILRREPLQRLSAPTVVRPRRNVSQRIMRLGPTAAAAVLVLGFVASYSGIGRPGQRPAPSPFSTLTVPEVASGSGRVAPEVWPGGLPRVKARDIPVPLGQRGIDFQ